MPLHCGSRRGREMTHSAVNQTAQQIVMRRIVAFGHLLIVGELFLYQVIVLLAHNRRYRDRNPVAAWLERIALAWAGGCESRAALPSRDRAIAIAIGGAGVHRVGQHTANTGVCAAHAATRTADASGLEVLDDAINTTSLSQIPGVDLLNHCCFIGVDLNPCRIAWVVGIQ